MWLGFRSSSSLAFRKLRQTLSRKDSWKAQSRNVARVLHKQSSKASGGHRDFAWAVRATLYTQLLGMHLPQLVSLGCAIIMHFGRFACCEPGSIWLAWLGSPPADFHLSRKVLCFCNGVLSTLLFAIAMSIRAMARQSVGLPAGRNGCLPASCRASFRFCSFCISALARVVTVDR